MSKQPLQKAFPKHRLMTIKECLNELNWKYDETGNFYKNITCDCGTEVKYAGWIGTEHAW